MSEALGERIHDASRRIVGDGLLAVTVYTQDGIYHEYLSDAIGERADPVELDALYRPATQIHSLLDFVSRANPLGGTYEGSIHNFENVTVLHFPSGEDEGVLVSLDLRGERATTVYSECLPLVDGESSSD